MCGIIGYAGKRDAVPLILAGLKRLEYRGYDSAGVASISDGAIQTVKSKGKVSDLNRLMDDSPLTGSIGIGHTRWATHGAPSDVNAHPHSDASGEIALVHNGIIENYDTLRTVLLNEKVEFTTETDTEVLAQLIGRIYSLNSLTLEEAVQSALQDVVGTYGIVVISSKEPDTMVAARMGSPLLLGVGEGEYVVASDASPIVEHTRDVIYLDDGDLAVIRQNDYEIHRIKDNHIVTKEVERVEVDLEEIEKGGFPHFMLKEIHEQSHTIVDTLRGRIVPSECRAHLGGIQEYVSFIQGAHTCYVTACGTSWHASLIGAYLLEEYARFNVKVEYASEFRYRNSVVDQDCVVFAVSQSGETADTLAAVRKAKDSGALSVGICNVVGSSIARETDCGIFTHAGPEIGVASTKAFTSQVAVFILMTLQFRRARAMSWKEAEKICQAIMNMNEYVTSVLSLSEEIATIAREYREAQNFIYLGRGLNFPVALEGALKLKEISYIHAEGYPAAEMKHGPIALIDERMPVVVLAPKDRTYEKVISNIQEVRARNGRIITLTDHPSDELRNLSDHVIQVPLVHRIVFPLLAAIPLQLLAYHMAVLRGCDVDQPRNLAKSVTVE